jgi:hypothetical protein
MRTLRYGVAFILAAIGTALALIPMLLFKLSMKVNPSNCSCEKCVPFTTEVIQ